ncbi:MAG: type II secretion system F family protein [Acidobacteriia bacterium]|nr:type II secretion system F family protein [Terriglobia bacterium]
MQHPLLFSICAFLMLLVILSWGGYRVFYKPGRFLKQLGSPVITGAAQRPVLGEMSEPESSTVVTLLKQLGSKIPSSEAEVATLRTELMRAGFRAESAVPVFYGLRIVATMAMLLVSLIMQPKMPPNPALRMAVLLFGCATGWILPRFFLEKKIAKRQEILRLSLPDMLDMLVVSVEAGLGLDQAMHHVSHELQMSHPQLSEELAMVMFEMRAGKRRAEALRNLAERTGESEIRKLVAILVQNDRFGTSMGESLRTHSDFLRSKRRQEAEERAGKVGVKLVFPIFFFILPSMLIVAAGPGILQIFKYLFPMMKQIG